MSPLLPMMISRDRIVDEQECGDVLEMIFLFQRDMTADEVIDKFVNDAHLHLLYHHVVSEGLCGWQSICAFSHPDNIRMYKFNVNIGDGGFASEVIVSIFETLEFFTSEVLEDLDSLNQHGPQTVAMDRASVLRLFFTS